MATDPDQDPTVTKHAVGGRRVFIAHRRGFIPTPSPIFQILVLKTLAAEFLGDIYVCINLWRVSAKKEKKKSA